MMSELTGFQRDLMFVLSGLNQPSGQELKNRLEEPYDDEINHGRLYPNLDTLVDKGYVKKGSLDRRTNCYELTESGRELIQARRQWENSIIESQAD
jgi:DNA-binding PadR family transcriptional regulator